MNITYCENVTVIIQKKNYQQGDLIFVDAKRRGDNVFSKQVLVLLESRYNAHIHLPSLTTGFL